MKNVIFKAFFIVIWFLFIEGGKYHESEYELKFNCENVVVFHSKNIKPEYIASIEKMKSIDEYCRWEYFKKPKTNVDYNININ